MHILPALGEVRLAHLRPQHVRALIARKSESGLKPAVGSLHPCGSAQRFGDGRRR